MSKSLGLTSTGVIVRDSETGTEYGLHAECLPLMLDALGSLADPFSPDYRMAVIGPLFADASEWACALNGCTHTS